MRRVQGAPSYVAFTLSGRERARMQYLADRLGFANLDALVADLFRIGLQQVKATFAPASALEQRLHQRRGARVRGHAG